MSTETDTKVVAELREQFGKGFARRLRAAGKIPAVIYGHGTDPVHITLPAHDTSLALKHPNALLTIVLGKDSQMAIAKDVQRDPVKRIIEHIDLIIVKKGEKITVDVPLHVVGESATGDHAGRPVAGERAAAGSGVQRLGLDRQHAAVVVEATVGGVRRGVEHGLGLGVEVGRIGLDGIDPVAEDAPGHVVGDRRSARIVVDAVARSELAGPDVVRYRLAGGLFEPPLH